MINPYQIISNIAYAGRWFSRLLWALIILPATGFFMLALFAGNWSFDGLARQLYEQAAELRVLDTNPPTFSVKVCADPKPDPKSPPVFECSQWAQQTQGLDEIAASTGGTMRVLYGFFVVIALLVMALCGRLVPKRPMVANFRDPSQVNGVLDLFNKTTIIKPFQPNGRMKREKLRAFLEGLRIRYLLGRGYGVVIMGAPRTGKTFLLERTFPGRIVCPDIQLRHISGNEEPFRIEKVPAGMFAIDEAQLFEQHTFKKAFPDLRTRKVAFAVQSFRMFDHLDLGGLFGDRVVIIFLGDRDQWMKSIDDARGERGN